MYIITRGVIKKQGGFEGRAMLLTTGDNFGTDMLLTPDARRWHTCTAMSYSCASVLAADDLFNLEEEKPWLFTIASKTMRSYKNCLRCAYALQVFGSQVKREIKREKEKNAKLQLERDSRAVAEEKVYGHYRGEFAKGASWHRLQKLSSVSSFFKGKEANPDEHGEIIAEYQAQEVRQQLDEIDFGRLPLDHLLGLQSHLSELQERFSESVGAAATIASHTNGLKAQLSTSKLAALPPVVSEHLPKRRLSGPAVELMDQ